MYYIADGGRIIGPLTFDEFMALLESGSFGADAMWRRDSDKEFRPVIELTTERSSTRTTPQPGQAAPPPVSRLDMVAEFLSSPVILYILGAFATALVIILAAAIAGRR